MRYEEALLAFKEATSHYEGTLKLISDTEAEFTATRKCVTSHQRFMVFAKGDPRKATQRIKGM